MEQKETKQGISRRSFLGTLAVGGAIAAAVGVAGCTPKNESSQTVSTKTREWSQEVELLVCGCGGAGMSCVLEAFDNGVAAKDILVIEKLSVVGGTTSTSQGMIGGFDTELQKAQSIKLTFEEMYRNLMHNALYRLDPALTKITIERCGETVDWLKNRVKVAFMDDVYVGYGPLKMMHIVIDGGGGLASALTKRLDEIGVNVETETKLVEILLDEDGRAEGVVAQQGSKELLIKAKAIVVATGGYAYNPELTERLDPEKAGTFGIGFVGSEGDGIVAASNAGAALSHTNDMMCVLKDYVIMTEHKGTSASANVNGFTALANMILVGAAGKRFCNEDLKGFLTQSLNSPVFDQMHRDEKGYVWMISDQATVDATNGVTFRGEGLSYIKGSTYAEFARGLGVDAAALEATIEAFNEAVEEGVDREFGRFPKRRLEPPYLALPVVPCEIITYGGIARNAQGEVIKADGEVIPGLYTAGETSCNSAYMGFTISNAITWGRIAGKSATSYLSNL